MNIAKELPNIHYNSAEERLVKSRAVKELNKSTGSIWRMTSDTFDNPSWEHGDLLVGVMAFTDELEPVTEQKPSLEDRVAALEKKAGIAR